MLKPVHQSAHKQLLIASLHCAADNLALSTEVSRLREYVHRGEREALLTDVEALQAELLRVSEALERMQALPQARVAT